MASHVERVIDFLERCQNHADMPKMLSEDIQWAIDIISANNLYGTGGNNLVLDVQRPEIKAWKTLINLEWIPTNEEEMNRLKKYEESYKLNDQKKKKVAIRQAKKDDDQKPFNPEDT